MGDTKRQSAERSRRYRTHKQEGAAGRRAGARVAGQVRSHATSTAPPSGQRRARAVDPYDVEARQYAAASARHDRAAQAARRSLEDPRAAGLQVTNRRLSDLYESARNAAHFSANTPGRHTGGDADAVRGRQRERLAALKEQITEAKAQLAHARQAPPTMPEPRRTGAAQEAALRRALTAHDMWLNHAARYQYMSLEYQRVLGERDRLRDTVGQLDRNRARVTSERHYGGNGVFEALRAGQPVVGHVPETGQLQIVLPTGPADADGQLSYRDAFAGQKGATIASGRPKSMTLDEAMRVLSAPGVNARSLPAGWRPPSFGPRSPYAATVQSYQRATKQGTGAYQRLRQPGLTEARRTQAERVLALANQRMRTLEDAILAGPQTARSRKKSA